MGVVWFNQAFKSMRSLLCLFLVLFSNASLRAAITITGVADKTKYDNTVTFSVTADASAATTTATLDGVATTVGSAVVVTSIRYHELKAESRTAGGVLVDSKLIRFIVRDSVRAGSEDGIPQHTPYRLVNDAPSAFAGGTLKVLAPAAWPAGLPVPLGVRLLNAANEGLRLNGIVTFSGFPGTTLQMRRGWGSVVAPAQTTAGALAIGAQVNGVALARAITIETAPVFTSASGTIASNTTWAANSRIHVTGTLTISAGATLTVGAGTVVKVYTGTGTAGSAAEIVVNGTLQCNGTEASPVVFAPDTAGGYWGGIELPVTTSVVNANYTIFHGSGEEQAWFDTHAGYTTHKPQQALFLIAGSGTGTAFGAQLHLADCFCFSLAGQQMNGKPNTQVDIQRTLMQRAVTCGELHGGKVTIDRSALIEFPSETATFADADNDALYLTHGDLSLTNNVIGFGKDDGVDSGGNGGDNPYTAAVDVTPYVNTGNWFEGTFHEGNSLSGTRNVTFTGCVFYNVGQGVEAGYSAGAGTDGPNALVDGCLFVSNMVGVRWGDNYGSGYSYNGSMEVKNSLILNSIFKDAFSGQWHPTLPNAWIYQDATATNTFGRPYFDVHNNTISQPDPLHHPANTQWNPADAVHTAALVAFMPVPGSAVGVGISSYEGSQPNTTAYPGTFTVRLSTFSSLPVTVSWAVVGKTDPLSAVETSLGGGTLLFQPGETLKTVAAPVSAFGDYGLIRVVLLDPVNAEVTGQAAYLKPLPGNDPNLINFASVWKYLDNGTDQGTTWRNVGFNDSGWKTGAGEFGYGDGDETTTVEDNATPGYVNPDTNRYATTYFRKTFTVADVSAITSLAITMRYDDGGAIYINGLRVAGTASVPIGSLYGFFIGGTAPPDNSILTASFTPAAAALVNGVNTIAVEIHQQSDTSSDMSFDLQLIATITPPPLKLNYTTSGGYPLLWWYDGAAALERSTDLLNWTPAPIIGSPLHVIPSGPKEFFRLRK